MRLHIAKPGEHVAMVDWPYMERLDDWTIPGLHEVTGLHRHVVRIVESGDTTYVVKELPDHLAEREWRLLRELDAAGLPTAEVVGVVTERDADADGLLITRNIDYSLPYRVLLSGRGLQIPYLGERVLDALAGLLVQAAPRRVLLGRLLAVEHPVPARRRRAQRLHHRRRDRRAPPDPVRRTTAARSVDRHRERRRRSRRPAGRRAVGRRYRPDRDGTGDRDDVPAAVDRADRRRRVRHQRDLPHRPPAAAAARARLRRRRSWSCTPPPTARSCG